MISMQRGGEVNCTYPEPEEPSAPAKLTLPSVPLRPPKNHVRARPPLLPVRRSFGVAGAAYKIPAATPASLQPISHRPHLAPSFQFQCHSSSPATEPLRFQAIYQPISPFFAYHTASTMSTVSRASLDQKLALAKRCSRGTWLLTLTALLHCVQAHTLQSGS